MSTDAIVLLKADHKDIREQFRRFQQAGANAAAAKGRIVENIIELLTVHTYIENEVMYPEVRRPLPDLQDDVLESYEEHHVADLLVAELAAMTPDADGRESRAGGGRSNIRFAAGCSNPQGRHFTGDERNRLSFSGFRRGS